ncbi:hypothetical protein [Ornithinimicrobium ciconiae]|nr:hypothetical protein [Ornithinimicrobium ciconiae]
MPAPAHLLALVAEHRRDPFDEHLLGPIGEHRVVTICEHCGARR